MNFRYRIRQIVILLGWQLMACTVFSQGLVWADDGNSYFTLEDNGIVQHNLPTLEEVLFLPIEKLTPPGAEEPLAVESFTFSNDNTKVLLYTNSQRVWRYNTRGDYWVFDRSTNSLRQLGKGRPESSLMFAKFSPDGSKVAYVSERNVYVENLANGQIKKLTDTQGLPKLINGTFDWVYEEEFSNRDGFRWAPNGNSIAYWQIDANKIRDFYMINNTDSIYSQIIPVEYPKVGDPPSPARIGVVDIASAETTWMDVPGDPEQHYIVRMEWAPDGDDIILQQLNRLQNESKLMLADPESGETEMIYTETDEAWVSTISEWSRDVTGWDWIDSGKSFLWLSEKDGWRHLYRISRDGEKETLLTNGNYDVISVEQIVEDDGYVYFMASPTNPLQEYLYRVSLKGKGRFELITPFDLPGTHAYNISPNGEYARHSFSNYFTPRMSAWVSLPDHKPLPGEKDIASEYDPSKKDSTNVEFFEITTEDGVTVNGWMRKPYDFDETKKYPVVFYVYSYPGSHTVADSYGKASNFIYGGDMSKDGYLHISLDNRGSDLPKGRKWRKAIYAKVGQVNTQDQAMAARQIMEWDFVDTSRVAVWGWSGGGSTTLDLLFRYPEIYKTGISIAPVTDLRLYDNIYTERFMGLPDENEEAYIEGSPITHAENLEGDLLLIHGTADDNVHFQNAEMLVNELVKHNKQFRYMAYPGRSHGLGEGEGTFRHLVTLVTNFLHEHCPPGGMDAGKNVDKP